MEFNSPFKRPYKPKINFDNKPLFGDMIFRSSAECYDGSILQTHMVDDMWFLPEREIKQNKSLVDAFKTATVDDMEEPLGN
jgi:hypothetical protein